MVGSFSSSHLTQEDIFPLLDSNSVPDCALLPPLCFDGPESTPFVSAAFKDLLESASSSMDSEASLLGLGSLTAGRFDMGGHDGKMHVLHSGECSTSSPNHTTTSSDGSNCDVGGLFDGPTLSPDTELPQAPLPANSSPFGFETTSSVDSPDVGSSWSDEVSVDVQPRQKSRRSSASKIPDSLPPVRLGRPPRVEKMTETERQKQAEESHNRRLLRNRRSAAISRQRQKGRIGELESTIREMRAANDQLVRENEVLRMENAQLKAKYGVPSVQPAQKRARIVGGRGVAMLALILAVGVLLAPGPREGLIPSTGLMSAWIGVGDLIQPVKEEAPVGVSRVLLSIDDSGWDGNIDGF